MEKKYEKCKTNKKEIIIINNKTENNINNNIINFYYWEENRTSRDGVLPFWSCSLSVYMNVKLTVLSRGKSPIQRPCP